jgi:hypothetical protein
MSTPDETASDVRIALPLWGLGAAVALWGLLRGRPLVFLLGAGAFFADRDAEPVRRVRELVGLELHWTEDAPRASRLEGRRCR